MHPTMAAHIGFLLIPPRYPLVSLANAEVMPATLDCNVWSLWSNVDGKWHHMATSKDHAELSLKAQMLRRLFTNRRFLVVEGASMPRD